jgi:uncharacterized SAM-binding protein YcdF (DUF218 family)
MVDAIVVLGRGILPDGTLPAAARARVGKASELYQAKTAPRIIMSGRWTFLEPPQWPRTEAAAMKELAIEQGVPAEAVLVEDQSVDTLGNAYFTKQKFLEPNGWRKLNVVSSPEHMPRVKLIFRHVLGPSYQLEFEACNNTLAAKELAAGIGYERRIQSLIEDWLKPVEPGNDEQLWARLQEVHPGYSKHARYTVDDIKKMVGTP